MRQYRLIAWLAVAVLSVGAIVLYGRHHASALQHPLTANAPLPPVRDRRPLPAFAVADTAGRTLRPSDFAGRPLVVTFFASWCYPCQIDAPRIAQLAHRYAGRVRVLAISIDDTSQSDVTRFAARYGWSFPIVYDPADHLIGPFGVAYKPTTLLVDAHGMIVWKLLGPLDSGWVSGQLDRLIRT
jgi:cytochrome c biogenesis protein CcmG, thiol:disulfide interchange protein DsbE